ncbi:hypothetical protein [Aquimarina longa]|uniref:hypothetical protein n=1 Tax=Aquimarina longa TaxID=1080221 RepID=UPI000785CE5D|nr:hypothetical protein [Aquimarina longa]
MNTQNSIQWAATILHEGIHAELYKFVDQVHNREVNPNDRKKLFDLYKNYKGLKSMSSRAQHNYMTDKYVIPIAKAIRELDNNKYPLEYYMGFGWEGLKANAHPSLLTNDEFNEYLRLKSIVIDNTNFNPNDCN